ncbi:AI-2E family transporter [Aquihabitans sp. G128]|uniref:AI-2E family transporter n=1 Tax=Aquihabitans sp. G128 TaxID=2849779 RepID=UPI001C22E43D|nr:AI-2E family transporter [Aquihabitans sp. G128]QXC62459.1 AI-2E family transporter [Aquihabitans sp. G128]
MDAPAASWRPHPAILRFTAYAACTIVVGYASKLVLELLTQLSIVLFPVITALFLTRVLAVPGNWLRRRGWPPALAAASVLVGFLVLVAGLVMAVVPPVVHEFSDFGTTIDKGTQQIEDWLVEDSAFDVKRKDVEDFKDDLTKRSKTTLENSTDTIARGARLVIEALVSLILSLVLTFFAIKDGPEFQRWMTGLVPRRRRPHAKELANASWVTLGGYLRGAALLGILEAVVIGGAMFFAGAHLVVPVMLLTFAAAFIPLVGATVAGVLAVLVTLASAGLAQAVVVAIVALVVQQLDNELLAPWIYGKALSMHPVVILLSITAGTALFGFVGTLLAVPFTAIAMDSVAIWKREHPSEDEPGDGDGDVATGPDVALT